MILLFITLLLSIPSGLLIAWLARDELIDGFVYLNILFYASFVSTMIFSFYNEVYTLSFGFVCVVSYISILKRFDNEWAVERKR